MPFSYLYTAQTYAQNSGKWTQGNTNKWRYEMSGVPFIGDFIRAQDYHNWMNDYMRSTGVTWDSMKYPSLQYGAGSSARAIANLGYGAGYAYVSRNLMSLYRNGYARRDYRGPEYG